MSIRILRYKDDENFFDEPGVDEFDIDYQVKPTAKQVATDYIGVNVYTDEQIGTSKNVQSGSTASAEWKKLPGNSFSSWYTKVTDGFGGTTVSDVMRFKTGAPVDKGHGDKRTVTYPIFTISRMNIALRCQ